MLTKDAKSQMVREFMSADVVALPAGATMHDAIELMVENRVSALPITDKADQCVGIITSSDLMEVTFDIDAELKDVDMMTAPTRSRLVDKLSHEVGREPVSSYASERVATIEQSSTLGAAAKLMLRERIHHLPVVDKEGALKGVLSSLDVVAAVADED